MSIWKLLGLGGAAAPPATGDTETVRKIARRLEALAPERARYIAAFAYLLGRVAHADLRISDEETRHMEEIVCREGHLPEEQAVLVVEIAKSQNRLFGATENFLVARELAKLATPEQRRELLDCLFAVSAADDAVSSLEEREIRLVASELGLSHREYVEARSAWSDKRDILRPFHEGE